MRTILWCLWMALGWFATMTASPLVVVEDRSSEVQRLLARHGVSHDHSSLLTEDSVVAILVSEGYLDAECVRQADTLLIRPGSRMQIAKLVVQSPANDTISWHGAFTRENLDLAVQAVISGYFERGYYFASGSVGEIERDGDKLTVHLAIASGPLVTLRQLRFEGLKRTKAEPLLTTYAASSGDTLTSNLLERIMRRSRAIDFLEVLPPLSVEPLPGYQQADIAIRFREREQLVFAGGVGYQNEQKQGLLWDISLQLRNLLGEGKQVTLVSQRRLKGRNFLDLTYRQPSQFLGKSDLFGHISTRDYRDQFYEFAVRAGMKIQVTEGTSLDLASGWKRVEPTDSIGYSRYDVAVGFTQQDLDNAVNPTRGYDLVAGGTYAYRALDRDSLRQAGSFNETRARLAGNFYRSIGQAIVIKSGLGYLGVESKDVQLPLSELYWFGGPGTLRGYQQEQFAVKRGLSAVVEPRLRFDGGYLFGFWDAAYMQLGAGGKGEDLYRQGFGFGVAVAARQRGFELSLGWNPDLALDQPFLSLAIRSDF